MGVFCKSMHGAVGVLLYVESKLPPGRNPPRRKKREERRYQWPLTPTSIHKQTLLIVILALILIQTNEVAGANADFLVSPKNQAVIAGDPAQFDCTPKDGEPQYFAWSRNAGKEIISFGPEIFADDVALLISGQTYNLYINSTRTGTNDALQYSCSQQTPQSKPPKTQSAQLLVLDVEPSCTVRPDDLTDLVEGESFTISCVASYAARWEADITCTDSVDGSALNMDKSSTKGKLDATNTTKNIPADQHGHSYTCQIYFPAPAKGEVPEDNADNKYNREAPSYSFTYRTNILHVQYRVRNVEIQDPQPEYNLYDTITCQAEGRPSPSFQWVDVNTNNIVPGYELLIMASMEGDQEYRCETNNTIRGVLYTASQTINFKVIVPPTTTPTTSATTLQSTKPPTVSVPLPSGLSGGAIAAIVIGVVDAIVVILVILFLLQKKRSSSVPKEMDTNDQTGDATSTENPYAEVEEAHYLEPVCHAHGPPVPPRTTAMQSSTTSNEDQNKPHDYLVIVE